MRFFNTFRFLVREGFRGLGKNWFMSAASIIVLISCLLITGSAYLLTANIDNAMEWAYGQNVVVVFAEKEVDGKPMDEEMLATLKEQILSIKNVATVRLQTKEELLEEYSGKYEDKYGDLFSELETDNPLNDAFYVTFKDMALFKKTVATISKLSAVESINSEQTVADTLVKVRKIVLTVGGCVVLFLLVVSLFIISNTIKLTVYSRRREIFIMRSVGATRAFIRFPFMVEGVLLGILAGGIALGLVCGLYQLLLNAGILEFAEMVPPTPLNEVWLTLLIGFMAVGVVTGFLGSGISISRYLKEQSDET